MLFWAGAGFVNPALIKRTLSHTMTTFTLLMLTTARYFFDMLTNQINTHMIYFDILSSPEKLKYRQSCEISCGRRECVSERRREGVSVKDNRE